MKNNLVGKSQLTVHFQYSQRMRFSLIGVGITRCHILSGHLSLTLFTTTWLELWFGQYQKDTLWYLRNRDGLCPWIGQHLQSKVIWRLLLIIIHYLLSAMYNGSYLCCYYLSVKKGKRGHHWLLLVQTLYQVTGHCFTSLGMRESFVNSSTQADNLTPFWHITGCQAWYYHCTANKHFHVLISFNRWYMLFLWMKKGNFVFHSNYVL